MNIAVLIVIIDKNRNKIVENTKQNKHYKNFDCSLPPPCSGRTGKRKPERQHNNNNSNNIQIIIQKAIVQPNSPRPLSTETLMDLVVYFLW